MGFLARALNWSGRSGRLSYAASIAFFLTAVAAVNLQREFLLTSRLAALAASILLALALIALIGHGVRRIHDLGWHGLWASLFFVPWLSLVLGLVLLALPGTRRSWTPAPPLLALFGRLAVIAVVVLALGRAVYTPLWVPAGSMKPTLLVGDYFLVRVGYGPAARGDVVVFRHPASGETWVKRLIGLPGDTVQMVAGQLWLNGAPVAQVPNGNFDETFEKQGPAGGTPRCANGAVGFGGICRKERLTENLPGGPTYDVLNIGAQALDDTAPATVPEGHVFLLGDNRDNSIDSRMPPAAGGLGPLPLGAILGRAEWVVFSSAGRRLADVFSWRPGRYFQTIR